MAETTVKRNTMIYLIIPAYNEEQNITQLFKNVNDVLSKNYQKHCFVVVNDGSSDNTVGIIESLKSEYNIVLVSHPTNLGVGQVFRTGFKKVIELSEADDDIFVTLEADNTSDPGILVKMIDFIKSGNDLALASCYSDEGGIENVNLYRLFLSQTANYIMKLLFSLHNIKTYSSFYRAYKKELLINAFKKYGDNFITEDGFVCMAEMLIKFNRLNCKIVEVPMVLSGGKRKDKSKMKTLRTIIEYFRFFARELIFHGNKVDSVKNKPYR